MKLLEHFTKLTIHPKNAQELKGLILQLAIQGKLTATWRLRHPELVSGSHHARELIKRIQKEKAQLIKEKKLRKEKPLPLITEAEKPFDLPDGWVWCRLRDLGVTLTGGTPSKSNPLFFGKNIPFIKPGDIQEGNVNYYNEGLSILGKEKLNRVAKKGSVLMVCLGTIGKCALIDRDCTFNQQINSIYSKFMNQKNLFYSLSSKYFYDVAWDNSTSTTIALLNKSKWESIPLPIPPLAEQQEIVRVVETLFSEVTQLEQLTAQRIALKESYVTSALHTLTTTATQKAWSAVQPQFQQFFTEVSTVQKLRETILQLAVQGKLTATWRQRHPELVSESQDARTLLEQIKAEKAKLIAEKKIKKEKPLPPITEDEIPYKLPEGWVWCRLGNLITFLNGYAFKSSTYIDDSNYQIIRLGNVKNNKFLLNEKQAFVSEEIGEENIIFKLHENDILTTLTGTRGKRDYCFTCVVKNDHLKNKTLLLNQRVGCIRTIDKQMTNLLNIFLKSLIILDQLFESETGTANQGNIGSTSFKNLIFPLPPLAEQKAIVKKVNALMQLCDRLEAQIQLHTTHSEQLMQAVLREVFEGNTKKVGV